MEVPVFFLTLVPDGWEGPVQLEMRQDWGGTNGSESSHPGPASAWCCNSCLVPSLVHVRLSQAFLSQLSERGKMVFMAGPWVILYRPGGSEQ